jgi:hypothetical protein
MPDLFYAGQTDYIGQMNLLAARAYAGVVVLSGAGAPAPGLGADGDYYLDAAGRAIYGPKSGGGWGSAWALSGPPGSETAYSTTTQQSTASTAFEDVAGLSFASAAGAFYRIEAQILFGNSGSGIGAGIKLKINCSGAGTAGAWSLLSSGVNSADISVANTTSPTIAIGQVNYNNSGSNGIAMFEGVVSPGEGTIALQFAAITAGVSSWVRAASMRVTQL